MSGPPDFYLMRNHKVTKLNGAVKQNDMSTWVPFPSSFQLILIVLLKLNLNFISKD